MIAERAEALRQRIAQACGRCGRDPDRVELLPVSKRQPVAALREAAALGFSRFGENYVQEAVAKHGQLPELSFNLIGPLQRNKVRLALEHFQEIQTVDGVELGARLRRIAEELQVQRGLWIQVDLWNEASKEGGCGEDDIGPILSEVRPSARLDFRGFMAIPPPAQPSAFPELAALRERWQQKLGQPLRLSIGMSSDLEAAITAGSDQVRIGTALFGARDQPI